MPQESDGDVPREILVYRKPVYPEITAAQWAVLSAMSDQRCEHMMEAMDFVADLSEPAKDFLKSADKRRIDTLNDNLDFYINSKVVWRFLWIAGAGILSAFVAVTQVWKAFGEYFTVKIK